MDPIKYIFEKPYLSSRIGRWQALPSQYDIVYMTQKAIKGSVIADMLDGQPINKHEHAGLDFPDEDILALLKGHKVSDNDDWIMRFDGALNASGKGVGAVLISLKGEHYPVAIKLKFKCTNNMAEYEVCALGIQLALDMKVKRLMIYGDSSLIINQLQGEWNTRDPKLTSYYEYLRPLIDQFEMINFDHMPRDQNQLADALATLASLINLNDDEVAQIKIICHDCPTYKVLDIEEEPDHKPWL